jgi:5,10-methylenetetrahydrofolate reductase
VGRVDRILDTLTLLDADKSISIPPKTLDMLRKEILEKAYNILQTELATKPETFKSTYNGGETEETKKFTKEVLDKVKVHVHTTYVNDDKDTLDSILREVEAGL